VLLKIKTNSMNPLLSAFNTPYHTAPFSQIKNEHFKQAIENGIAPLKP
jgi:hypothetical protein